MRLAGKKALVTDSSRGIGRAIALRFAQEGADVAINYSHSPDGAQEVLDGVTAAGRRGCVIQADLSRVADTRALIAKAAESLGALDILVNNAGVEKNAPFWE